jgi:hypothetical protein
MERNKMDEFYVLNGEQQQGPYTLAQMRGMWESGRLTGSMMFWREGMGDWEALRNIKNLLEVEKPPPLPVAQPPLITAGVNTGFACPGCGRAVSREADTCPGCGKPIKRGFLGKAGGERIVNTGCLIVILITVGLVMLRVLF